MKILFTGASSFTGMWFAKELVKAGHDLTTIFRKKPDAYLGLKQKRVQQVITDTNPLFECSFGDKTFFNTIKTNQFDVLCHHGAEVTNYKSADFDPIAAVVNNTYNIKNVLERLCESGCCKIVITGSVFEPFEGSGSDESKAFSPYGLSKGLTSEVFRYYTHHLAMKLGKFVIPNPFGPYEKERFTTYLAKQWLHGNVATVDYPAYVRDNIHVSLLARAYCHFIENLSKSFGMEKLNPSGYPESQESFVKRFSAELSARLKLPCGVNFKEQKHFPEPKVRINTDVLNPTELEWDENLAWDELAQYYRQTYGNNDKS